MAGRTSSQRACRQDAQEAHQNPHGSLCAQIKPASVGTEWMVSRFVACLFDGAGQLALQQVLSPQNVVQGRSGGFLHRFSGGGVGGRRVSAGRRRRGTRVHRKAVASPPVQHLPPSPCGLRRTSRCARTPLAEARGETWVSRSLRTSRPHPLTFAGTPWRWREICHRGSLRACGRRETAF